MILVGIIGFMVFHHATPLPSNQKDIERLRMFAEQRHLEWNVGISSDGLFYCSRLSDKDFNIVADCQSFIGSSVDGAIEKWNRGFGQKIAGGDAK